MEFLEPALLDRLASQVSRAFGLVEDAVRDGLPRAVLLRSRERGISQEELAASLLGAGLTEEEELGRLVHHLLLGHTRFYRHESVWEELALRLPAEFPGGPMRALIAGCSSGEEAWTAAFFLAASWGVGRFHVTAMDASPVALETARRGVYPSDEAARLPADWHRAYLQSASPGFETVVPAIRERVRFHWGNLVRKIPDGTFHLVMCRNVLTYLERPLAVSVVQGLFQRVLPGGCLVLASQELPVAEAACAALGKRWLPTRSGLPVLRCAEGGTAPGMAGATAHREVKGRGARSVPARETGGAGVHPWADRPGSNHTPAGQFESRPADRTTVRFEPHPWSEPLRQSPVPVGCAEGGPSRLVVSDSAAGQWAGEWQATEVKILEILKVPPKCLILDIKAVKGVDFRVKERLARTVSLLRSVGTDVRVEGDSSLLSR